MPTLSRRTDRAAEQRQRGAAALLAAAEELVAEGTPFGEVSVDAIAKRAGFSRATFYAYFADKRALALALGEQLAAELEREAAPWLRDGVGDLRDTLVAVMRVFAARQGTVTALVEAATYDEDVAALWRGLHERFRLQLRDRLRELGVDERAADARSYVLVWSTERCLTEHLAAPRVAEGDLVDAIVGMWRAALDEPRAR